MCYSQDDPAPILADGIVLNAAELAAVMGPLKDTCTDFLPVLRISGFIFWFYWHIADGAGLEPATSPGAIYQHSNQPLPTPVVPATSNLLRYPSLMPRRLIKIYRLLPVNLDDLGVGVLTAAIDPEPRGDFNPGIIAKTGLRHSLLKISPSRQ